MTDPAYSDPLVTVYQGDCLDVMRELPDASVDAVVTDPPYNLTFMGKSWDAFEGREDAGFGYWLAGLIDGEGHFAIKKHTRGTHAPAFALKMRADERGTLELIKRHTGIGTLAEEQRDGNPMVKWVVQDKAGCQKLVDLLDKYPLRAKKRQDYNIWRESVCEWTDRPRGNRWHGAVADDRMSALRGRLMQVRNYVEPAWSGHEYQDWTRLWALECFRILKPGGHLLSFSGTRTYHRMTSGIEDAGFEIRDSLHHIYASGFPKSLDVSKALDKVAGAEREVVGKYRPPSGQDWNLRQAVEDVEAAPGTFTASGRRTLEVTAPATDLARKWEGWGTALKPAHEPIVMARKPLVGTVAANVTRYGTGALNIDGTRIGTTVETWPSSRTYHSSRGPKPRGASHSEDHGELQSTGDAPPGRWPSNVLLSDPELFDEPNPYVVGSGQTITGQVGMVKTEGGHRFIEGDTETVQKFDHGTRDSGGYSRFFIIPKADRAERERGLAGAPKKPREAKYASIQDGRPHTPEGYEYHREARANVHPTVKPIDLMRHLVRLVTPPGGVVLDPFAGSGTTGLAASEEGFRSILIEREAEYCEIILGRLMATPMGLGLDHEIAARPQKSVGQQGPDKPFATSGYSQGWKGHKATSGSLDLMTRSKDEEDAA